jgi:hypothetical protein
MSIKLRPKLFFLLVALVVCDLAGGQTRSTNYDESKVGSYTLPDPLTFSNGKPVRNARDWKRRTNRSCTPLDITSGQESTP